MLDTTVVTVRFISGSYIEFGGNGRPPINIRERPMQPILGKTRPKHHPIVLFYVRAPTCVCDPNN